MPCVILFNSTHTKTYYIIYTILYVLVCNKRCFTNSFFYHFNFNIITHTIYYMCRPIYGESYDSKINSFLLTKCALKFTLSGGKYGISVVNLLGSQ